ncbi:MAG: ABC transporter substrate-binding protein [Oscillospiraceae bacterium]
MNKFKTVAAGLLASAMILSLTACDEEVPATANGGAAGASNSASNAGVPNSDANAVVTTPLVTTTYDTDPAVQDAAKGAVASLDNPDLEVTKRLKWMAWWDIDETTAAAELFKEAYGVPATGDDPSREGRIFEYINVAYGERYDKLATAIQSGDSPDLFPFEIRDFPYGVLKGRYQPVDQILNLDGEKWDGARSVMDQFQLGGRYYCAIYEISFDSLLYYRKSIVEGAGLKDPRTLFENDQWTWDAFLDMARTFQQSGDNKFVIDGYNPENEFVVATGTPIVANNNGVITNNMNDANVERAMELLSTLQKENLRYPRHELNGWSVNPKAWAQGDTLFYGNGGTWEFEGDSGLNKFAKRFGWSDDEICVVPYPRDPQADAYYHFMKQDALMWCKGSTNANGVAAWIDSCITASLDPAATAASIQQQKDKNGWSDYNLDFIYSQTTLDGSSKITPIFDFKNGLGTDIASADTADSNVEQLTKYVYIQGEQTYTQLREANFAVIDARIKEINDAIAAM